MIIKYIFEYKFVVALGNWLTFATREFIAGLGATQAVGRPPLRGQGT